MKVLLDTSGFIHFLRKQPHARQAIAQAEHVLFPVVALGEWLAGLHPGSAGRRETWLTDFLQDPAVTLQAIDADTPSYYAHLHQYLRKKGTPIPTNDLWIAACAMQSGACILTSDSHYLRLPQVLVDLISAY